MKTVLLRHHLPHMKLLFAIVAISILLVSEAFAPLQRQTLMPPTGAPRQSVPWHKNSRAEQGRNPLDNSNQHYSSSSHAKPGVVPLHALNSPDYSQLDTYVKSISPLKEGVIDPFSTAWGIGLVISVIYAISILISDEGPKDCQDGFCVTGYGENGAFIGGEAPYPTNSHKLAWRVDVGFVILCLLLPILSSFGINIPNIGSYEFAPTLDVVLSTAFLIGFHGYLHFDLAQYYVPPNNATLNTQDVDTKKEQGEALGFFIFSLVLVSVCVLGYSSVPEIVPGIPGLAAIIGGLTSFIYWLTQEGTKKGMGISSYFMSTQVLVAGVGYFVPDDVKADPLMAYTFAITCLVSLVEFYKCGSFLRKLGGHMWYDIALHGTLLTALWLSDSFVDQALGVATKALNV